MTTDMMLNEIKSGKYDIEGCPIKSDALYEYVKSFENSDDRGFCIHLSKPNIGSF